MGPIRIVVAGAAGRMGRCVARCVFDDAACSLVGAVEGHGHASIGRDAGFGAETLGVAITDDISACVANAEAIIDFTAPAVSADIAERAAESGVVHVIGSTGFTVDQENRISAAARKSLIVKSGNMSLGANLVAALARQAARVLRDFDVQVVEMHHRQKKDAPSGTALMLGRAVAAGRADRAGDAASLSDGIGFASLRGGTVVGEHRVIFAGPHERISIEHVAEDRSIFARGAIAAAKWGRGRRPGLYSMSDVLGL